MASQIVPSKKCALATHAPKLYKKGCDCNPKFGYVIIQLTIKRRRRELGRRRRREIGRRRRRREIGSRARALGITDSGVK
jgi:hypothetical protein